MDFSKLHRKILVAVIACSTVHVFGLTTGPTQPEVQQFTPVSGNNMVDFFTGNFTYNIPLFTLPGPNGGYPFNIGYNSGITMDQEATWVGLGWNINVGTINRQMRTLPDEFNGKEVLIKKIDQLDNKTVGMGLNVAFEGIGVGPKDIISLSPSYGLSMYYNTYKGFGLTTEIGVGVSFGIRNHGTAGIGITVRNDNQEGATFSPNLSLGVKSKEKDDNLNGSLNLGLNYNSNMGLQNISLSPKVGLGNGVADAVLSRYLEHYSAASMSFNNSFITSPVLKNSTSTTTFQGLFQIGGFAWGAQVSGALSGNFSNEVLNNKMKPLSYPAFGYMHLQEGQNNDQNAALDFIREKDGLLHKDIRNLASPILTYDIYSVTGHGFSGMFRPYRSDIGVVNDKQLFSTSDGVNVSLDASAGSYFQIGYSLNYPTTFEKSGKWSGVSGNIYEKYNFTQSALNSKHEPYRFQVYGEANISDKNEISNLIGGFEPSAVAISAATGTDKIDYTTLGKLKNKSGAISSITTNALSQRNPRQTDIKAIENSFLYGDNILPECNAYFINGNNPNIVQLDRAADTTLYMSHHIGAFIVTTSDGLRYIYSLPAYNTKHVENSFSVKTNYTTKEGINQLPQSDFQNTSSGEIVHNSTDGDTPYGYENYEKTEIPAYAYTWMLTAILGADYIDRENDGLTDDDLGYFVKFTYKKSTETYKWRAPFKTANFIEGQHAIDADNMGTYNYGERENYYLYSAETKSHIAYFYSDSVREDGRGAHDEFQKGNQNQNLGAHSYKLDSIQIFSKMQPNLAQKSIFFEYNKYNAANNTRFWVNNSGSELCQGVENAPNGRGKLTLKAIYTTSEQNEKGLLNPYIFNYNENNTAEDNPGYNPFAYDRWGNYQQYPTVPANSMLPIKYFPYTRQDVDVATRNKWASVWNLKEIILPSSAKITVDYEADRYAYVQNRPAMEMYKLKSINTASVQSGEQMFTYKLGSYATNENYVLFTLKRPIATAANDPQTIEELRNYIDTTKQLYYKIYVDLNGDHQWEFVTGYADIDRIELFNSTTAKILLKNIDLQTGKNPKRSEHPFVLASWNYAQANRPELLNDNANGPLESRPRTGREVMNIINTFISIFNPVVALTKFQNFYNRAANEGWGQHIDLDKSFIRLNSYLNEKENTIIEKFGGDSRVRSINLYENPTTTEISGGYYYDYTDTLTDGTLISSGVAANEPSIGGDECALHYGKIGFMEPRFKTAYLQFQEMPVNESYLPAAGVGYSKVSVTTHATHDVNNGVLASYIPTTGVNIHEYYTSKDFPTLFKETPLNQSSGTLQFKQPKLAFRPLGGTITESNLAATQGYYSELNDMHGKEKKVSYYGLDISGKVIPTCISSVEYLYKSNSIVDQNGTSKQLNNEVPVLYNHLGTIQNKLLGVDVENFVDTRQSESRSESEGGRFNLSVLQIPAISFPLPIPTYFPDLGYDQRRSYTCVDNKIVHKFGILEKTKVYKEGALTVTDNLVYDAYTGQPLLTTVNNEFNDTIYNYHIPAHLLFAGLSPSYSTNNIRFTGTVTQMDAQREEVAVLLPQWSVLRDYVQEGDEILIKDTQIDLSQVNPEEKPEWTRCHIMRVDEAKKYIWLQADNGAAPGVSDAVEMYMFRPFNRNILNGDAGNVVSKVNPLTQKVISTCK